ncbi:AAC(3) family N-acetyltransferase [Magnetococcus sp. PR-3]|uniref:AAC(3) family N-acetyltransferase n=1 Tax=Magnetococcus sp. PR-3 TaxID=3120355 RepID=UPI002FCE63EB
MNIYRIKQVIPKPLYPLISPLYGWIKQAQQRLILLREGPDIQPEVFRGMLQELGIQKGSIVLVHSAMDGILERVPGMNPVKLIELLTDMVGEEGTLLMPTFPFRGRQRDYIEQQPVFDRQKTPSRVGLMTEIFRRMPGVTRSLHPTHPLAGRGAMAASLLNEHHMGRTFGDATSPFYKLVEHKALIVGLGIDLDFTIQYVPEERHPRFRDKVFAADPVMLTMKDQGQEIPYAIHPTIAYRDYDHLWEILEQFKAEGIVTTLSRKGLTCTSVRADRYLERYNRLMDQGTTLFTTTPPSKQES